MTRMYFLARNTQNSSQITQSGRSDTGSLQFGASISRISLRVLQHWQNGNNVKTHKLILENASAN